MTYAQAAPGQTKPSSTTSGKNWFYTQAQQGQSLPIPHPDGRKVTVAFHNQPLPQGTLRSIIRQTEISIDEFLKLL